MVYRLCIAFFKLLEKKEVSRNELIYFNLYFGVYKIKDAGE